MHVNEVSVTPSHAAENIHVTYFGWKLRGLALLSDNRANLCGSAAHPWKKTECWSWISEVKIHVGF